MELKNFWVTFSIPDCLIDDFDYSGPWWCTEGEKEDVDVCFAIRAPSIVVVKEWLTGMFDEGASFEALSVNEQDSGWAPFSAAFEKMDWMVWPYRYAGEVDTGFSVNGTKVGVRDKKLERDHGGLSKDNSYIPGETVLFKDLTLGGEFVRCKIVGVSGEAVKIVPLSEDAAWTEAVVAYKMISKCEVQ